MTISLNSKALARPVCLLKSRIVQIHYLAVAMFEGPWWKEVRPVSYLNSRSPIARLDGLPLSGAAEQAAPVKLRQRACLCSQKLDVSRLMMAAVMTSLTKLKGCLLRGFSSAASL